MAHHDVRMLKLQARLTTPVRAHVIGADVIDKIQANAQMTVDQLVLIFFHRIRYVMSIMAPSIDSRAYKTFRIKLRKLPSSCTLLRCSRAYPF